MSLFLDFVGGASQGLKEYGAEQKAEEERQLKLSAEKQRQLVVKNTEDRNKEAFDSETSVRKANELKGNLRVKSLSNDEFNAARLETEGNLINKGLKDSRKASMTNAQKVAANWTKVFPGMDVPTALIKAATSADIWEGVEGLNDTSTSMSRKKLALGSKKSSDSSMLGNIDALTKTQAGVVDMYQKMINLKVSLGDVDAGSALNIELEKTLKQVHTAAAADESIKAAAINKANVQLDETAKLVGDAMDTQAAIKKILGSSKGAPSDQPVEVKLLAGQQLIDGEPAPKTEKEPAPKTENEPAPKTENEPAPKQLSNISEDLISGDISIGGLGASRLEKGISKHVDSLYPERLRQELTNKSLRGSRTVDDSAKKRDWIKSRAKEVFNIFLPDMKKSNAFNIKDKAEAVAIIDKAVKLAEKEYSEKFEKK